MSDQYSSNVYTLYATLLNVNDFSRKVKNINPNKENIQNVIENLINDKNPQDKDIQSILIHFEKNELYHILHEVRLLKSCADYIEAHDFKPGKIWGCALYYGGKSKKDFKKILSITKNPGSIN